MGVLGEMFPRKRMHEDSDAAQGGQQWRLGAGGQRPASALERILAAALARPLLGLVVALVGIAAVTAVLLVVGPPVPKS